MKGAEIRFDVRYAETDQMGIVHHSNYPIWFEAGRTAFLKSRGMTYAGIEARGVMLPLYEMSCRFLSPARYGDEVLVVSRIKHLTRVRATFSYEVRNAQTGQLLVTGETLHAWTDKALKPINAGKMIPDIYAALNQAMQEEEKE
jgi:acyl-CoA thioester hydrolase